MSGPSTTWCYLNGTVRMGFEKEFRCSSGRAFRSLVKARKPAGHTDTGHVARARQRLRSAGPWAPRRPASTAGSSPGDGVTGTLDDHYVGLARRELAATP